MKTLLVIKNQVGKTSKGPTILLSRVRLFVASQVQMSSNVYTRPWREGKVVLLTNISREEVLANQLSVAFVIEKEQYCYH